MLNMSESEEESQNESEIEIPEILLFYPPIESIHSLSDEEDGKRKFFVKFQNKSFRHCEWMTEEEMMERDSNIKNKLNRFVRDFDHNVQRKNNFFINYDQTYLEVDRVLDSSEIFPVLHPKKGS